MVDWMQAHFVPFLINATWQSSILIAVIFLLTRLLRRKAPVVRQMLWTLALFGALIVPFVNIGLNQIGVVSISLVEMPQSASASSPIGTTAQMDEEAQFPVNRRIHESTDDQRLTNDQSSPGSSEQSTSEPTTIGQSLWQIIRGKWRLFVSLMWAVGACLMCLRLIIRWLSLLRSRKAAMIETNPAIQKMVDTLTAQMGIRQSVEIRTSATVRIPCMFGIRKPVILLPLNLSDSLEPLELRAVLAHELAHVCRKDYPLHCCQSVIQAIYWFHPLVDFAAKQAARACEQVCDDWVLRVTGEQMAYAKGLTRFAEVTMQVPPMQPTLPLFRQKSDLFKRIESILNSDSLRHVTPSWKGWCALGLLGVGLICMAAATRVLGQHVNDEANRILYTGIDKEDKALNMALSIYYLHQAGERGKIAQLAPGSFVREAESADTIPDMFQVEVDENASGGQFLWRPEGATSGSGNALYNFTIPEAGIYKIIARTFATDGESDSFFIKFDDSKRYYTWYTAIWSEWNWEVLMGRRTDRAGADSYINRPIRFPLSVGEHQFQLRAREDGTRLDVLVFYREETMTQQLQAVENNPDAPYSMAKIYKAYGMYDEAITAYERAAELSPDEKHILEPLAKLYADSDLPGWQARALKAKAIYKHLIGLAQTSYDRTRYRRQLLDLHKQLGEIDAAITMLRDVAHSAPELLEGGAALRGIWKLYTDAGRSSEGVKMLEVLALQMEESSLLHEVLGDIYKQMGDSAKAKAAYTKSFELRQQETSPDGNA